ncbi:MAG: peptidylprolyl isomerase, partial [Gemmatimonadaceae bacterium]|nr:peptidylprolyl isomerase [Chitinophagaceae bacterium]
SPSTADTANLIESLNQQKDEFVKTPESDLNIFLSRNNTQINYNQQYVLRSKMQMPNADTIRNLADGAVFGPYFDATSITVAKMISKKSMPDSVKVRHILIKMADRQNPQMRDDSTAKKLADSIALAIRNGASFDELATKYNDDEGSKLDRPDQKLMKGEYEFASTTNLVKPFYDVAFFEPAGTKKVVKAESQDYVGYHYMEVMSQKNFETAYNVAYLAKTIMPSQLTSDSASGLASQFASESRNQKAFDENITKRNYNKLLASEIKPNDMAVPGVGSSRQLVKWVYDADKGDVSEMFEVDDKFIVAMVTDISEEGAMSPAKARPLVEYIIRNRKKAEQLKQKIGTPTNLQAVASAMGVQVQRADSLSFQAPNFPNAGMEAKVGGYVFNPASKGKISAPLAGNAGVFVVQPENIYARANTGANVEQQQIGMIMSQKSSAAQRGIDVLRKSAKVKDNRSKYF